MKTESAFSLASNPSQAPDGPRALHSWSENTPRATGGFGAAASYSSRKIPDRQERAFAAAEAATAGAGLCVVQEPKRALLAPQRIVLRGDPAVLRRLRAAEMAAWEAFGPKTTPKPNLARSHLRSRGLGFSSLETMCFLTLAAAAAAGVVIGLVDLYDLLAGWNRLTRWIDNLV